MKKIFLWMFILMWTGVCAATPVSQVWWQRTDPGATWQEWTFSSNANPAVPETYSNPYGIPSASISATGDAWGPAGWYSSWLGRSGVWHGDVTTILLTIPNAQVPNPYKEIWVEVGFRGFLLPDPAFPEFGPEYAPNLDAWIGGNPVNDVVSLGNTIEFSGDGWKKLVIGWRIYPNPDLEQIFLAFHDSGADIDYVTVDSICIPEPASLGLILSNRPVKHRGDRECVCRIC